MTALGFPRVVFDFGAVLFRWRPAVVIAQVWPDLAQSPQHLERAVADCFQGYDGDWGLFDQGLIDAEELAQRHERRLGWPAGRVRDLVTAAAAELQPQPDVLAVLLALRAQGRRLSFLSNMPKDLVAALRERYPLSDWFEGGVFSSEVKLRKPDPAVFALATARFGEAVGDCLLIDDHPSNVAAARAHGWQAELFTGAESLRAALVRRGLLPQ